MPATDARAATKTILVIDDDVDFAASVRAILEHEGYTVVTAGSGKEGLARLRESKPDLVILDVMLETKDEGYSVNETIKYAEEYRAHEGTPIIMVSSIQESPEALFPRAPEVGMIDPDYYMTKPLDIPAFLTVVKRELRG